MASSNRAASVQNRTNVRSARGMYVDGNAARQIQEVPARQYRSQAAPARRNAAERVDRERRRELSNEVKRNREKAMSMGRTFVVFLAVVCVAVLFFCVNYLQLQSEKTAAMKTVATLESEWSELKEENDAYEAQVNSNVDLNSIKKTAIGSLGMNYPTDEQTMTYSVPSNSYVRQYQDVPESN